MVLLHKVLKKKFDAIKRTQKQMERRKGCTTATALLLIFDVVSHQHSGHKTIAQCPHSLQFYRGICMICSYPYITTTSSIVSSKYWQFARIFSIPLVCNVWQENDLFIKNHNYAKVNTPIFEKLPCNSVCSVCTTGFWGGKVDVGKRMSAGQSGSADRSQRKGNFCSCQFRICFLQNLHDAP